MGRGSSRANYWRIMLPKIVYSSPTKRRSALVWAFLLCVLASRASAQSTLDLRVTITEDESKRPRDVQGEMTFRPNGDRREQCFWLPYNDPSGKSEWAIARRFGLKRERYSTAKVSGGRTSVSTARPNQTLTEMSESIIK